MSLAAYKAQALALTPIHLWMLDEASGTSFDDAQANNDGVAAASPARTTAPDGFGSAVNFAATTNSVLLPGSNVTLPKTHTICYWIKLNSQAAGDAMALEWGTAAFAKYTQHCIGTTTNYVGGGGTGQAAFAAYYGTVAGATHKHTPRTDFPNGTWKFVCETMDPDNAGLGVDELKLFLDLVETGITTGSTNFEQTQTPGAGVLGIGGRGQGGRNLAMDGALSGVAIFDHVLTVGEMTGLRNAMLSTGQQFVAAGQATETDTATHAIVQQGARVRLENGRGSADGYNHNAFPGMDQAADGNYVIAYQHSNTHSATAGTIRVVRVDGTDHILSEEDVRVGPAGWNACDVGVLVKNDGEVMVTWNESSTPGTASISTVVKTYAIFSTSHGQPGTWSAPIEVANGFATNGAGVAGKYGIAPSSPIQLSATHPTHPNRLLWPTYGFDDKTSLVGEYELCMYSDDEGRTFSVLSTIAPKNVGVRDYDEGDLELLDDDTLLCAIRTTESGGFPSIWFFRSTDFGATWDAGTRTFGTGASTTGYGGRPNLHQAPNGDLFVRLRYMNAGVSSWPTYWISQDRGYTFDSGHDPYDLATARTGAVPSGLDPRGVDVYSASAPGGASNKIAFVWAEEDAATQGALYFRQITLPTVGVQRATETDTAQSITPAHPAINVGQAAEADDAQAVTAVHEGHIVSVGLATEADVAYPVAPLLLAGSFHAIYTRFLPDTEVVVYPRTEQTTLFRERARRTGGGWVREKEASPNGVDAVTTVTAYGLNEILVAGLEPGAPYFAVGLDGQRPGKYHWLAFSADEET